MDLEYKGTFPWGDPRDVDMQIFGVMTSAGYFFFVIILIIGIVMGDNNHKFTVMRTWNKSAKKIEFQLMLFNFFGFLFFIAIGSERINTDSYVEGVSKIII